MSASFWAYSGLLVASNVFMTFAWYGHLRYGPNLALPGVILLSWFIAFFEYSILVPATRYGYQFFSVTQMKVMQEVITLLVFVPFAVLVVGEKLRWNHLWAALCLVGAVYFAFKK
ncbi:MAG: DMT family protein [Pigmentiphaga sp.]